MNDFQNMNWSYRPTTTGWNGQYPPPSPMPARQMPNQQFDNVVRVSGPEGAKEFKIPPNSRAILMDAYNPIFYLKTTDDGGFATLKAFKFEEDVTFEQPIPVIDPDIYATKEDVKSLGNSIDELKKIVEGLV